MKNQYQFNLINGASIGPINNYKTIHNEFGTITYLLERKNKPEAQIQIPYHAIAFIEVIHIE
jgi:hypothetical protein